ncbi:MAG: hypothetical protein AAFV80_14970 [Bacteroidota bacterium]
MLKSHLIAFAEPFQAGQTRKYSDEPILEHWNRVAEASEALEPDRQKCAYEIALFHDLIEDTTCDMDQLVQFLQASNYPATAVEQIQAGVEWLTEKYTRHAYPMLNRKERNILEAYRLGDAPALIQTIKYCDIADNLPSIAHMDPGFARKWIPEKIIAVQQMTEGHADKRSALLEDLHEALMRLV